MILNPVHGYMFHVLASVSDALLTWIPVKYFPYNEQVRYGLYMARDDGVYKHFRVLFIWPLSYGIIVLLCCIVLLLFCKYYFRNISEAFIFFSKVISLWKLFKPQLTYTETRHIHWKTDKAMQKDANYSPWGGINP